MKPLSDDAEQPETFQAGDFRAGLKVVKRLDGELFGIKRHGERVEQPHEKDIQKW